MPAFRKDGAVKREFIFFQHEGNRALRMGDWKLVSARENEDQWELYNLARDRSELHDLAATQPDRARRMESRWKELETTFRGQYAPNGTAP